GEGFPPLRRRIDVGRALEVIHNDKIRTPVEVFHTPDRLILTQSLNTGAVAEHDLGLRPGIAALLPEYPSEIFIVLELPRDRGKTLGGARLTGADNETISAQPPRSLQRHEFLGQRRFAGTAKGKYSNLRRLRPKQADELLVEKRRFAKMPALEDDLMPFPRRKLLRHHPPRPPGARSQWPPSASRRAAAPQPAAPTPPPHHQPAAVAAPRPEDVSPPLSHPAKCRA